MSSTAACLDAAAAYDKRKELLPAMTQRENILRLLHRQQYEFAPVEFNLCPKLVEIYRREENQPTLGYDDYFEFPWRSMPGPKPDTSDVTRFYKYHEGRMNERVSVDNNGVGHEWTPTSMHMTKMLCPLDKAEDVDDILTYPLPNYTKENNPNLKVIADAIHARGYASCGNMQCTIWESAWYIRGMENLMCDMMSDDEMATVLFDRVTEMSMQRALLYAEAGVDILYLGDDIGMQSRIMMSRELYMKWIQPRLKKIISAVKSISPEIIVFYHSCGYIEPLIPDLIDAGIDTLNPIQSECMDFADIWEKYHDKLTFHGTIGTQTVMPFGTPDEVRETVWRNLDIAKDGGLIAAPTHMLEPEVPWANVRAYVDACRDYKC